VLFIENAGDDFHVVLAEAFEAEGFRGGIDFAVGPDFGEAMLGGPLGGFGVEALAIFDHRGEEEQVAATAQFGFEAGGDLVAGLGLDGDPAAGTILRAKPGKEEAQEMVNFGDGGDGAFAAAARDALFDADGRGNAGDQVHFGPGQLGDELAGVGVHGIQETALSLGKQEVEGQGAFARTADARDDHELVARDIQGDVLEIVFARAVDGNYFGPGGVRLSFHFQTPRVWSCAAAWPGQSRLAAGLAGLGW
jgi:hypothetical protein